MEPKFPNYQLKHIAVSRNLTEIACHTPVRDRAARYNIMLICMTAFAAPTVVARLAYSQFFSAQRRLNLEDWAILAAVPVALPCVAFEIYGLTGYGLGKDIWGVPLRTFVDFNRNYTIAQVLYITLLTFIKLSLTFFYIRIFSGKGVCRLLWATVAMHIAIGLAFVLVVIFQCIPLTYQWEKFDYLKHGSLQGHCINSNAGGWANGAITVASDFWLLGIPLYQIRELRLHWKKRLCATLMFMTGAMLVPCRSPPAPRVCKATTYHFLLASLLFQFSA